MEAMVYTKVVLEDPLHGLCYHVEEVWRWSETKGEALVNEKLVTPTYAQEMPVFSMDWAKLEGILQIHLSH